MKKVKYIPDELGWIHTSIEVTMFDQAIDLIIKSSFFTGAGISLKAGYLISAVKMVCINISKDDLPYPEAIFDISYFKEPETTQ